MFCALHFCIEAAKTYTNVLTEAERHGHLFQASNLKRPEHALHGDFSPSSKPNTEPVDA